MPETAEKILAQLNAQARDWEDLDKTGLYPSGGKVTDKPEILFARLDVGEVMEKVTAMEELPPKPSCPPSRWSPSWRKRWTLTPSASAISGP